MEIYLVSVLLKGNVIEKKVNLNLEGRQAPQASSAFRTPTAGSLQSWDRRVRPRLV